VVFHNAFSPFRQTEGQRGCNEILKRPFFSFRLSLSPPSSISQWKDLSQKIEKTTTCRPKWRKKNMKADNTIPSSTTLFYHRLCMSSYLFSHAFSATLPLKMRLFALPNTHHSRIHVEEGSIRWKQERAKEERIECISQWMKVIEDLFYVLRWK